jgi:hypothetical protein
MGSRAKPRKGAPGTGGRDPPRRPAPITNFSPQPPVFAILNSSMGRLASPANIIRKQDMNAHIEMDPEEVLRLKLEVLRSEHRDLDAAIHALIDSRHPDQLRLVRLKKQKLKLKDEIARIEDNLTPDIIA